MQEDIESDELFFNPGWFNSKEYSSYSLETGKFEQALNDPELDIFALGIYSDPIVIKRSRAIYNTLDLLGDVGGLFDGFRVIFSVLIGFVQSGVIENTLIKSLFYQKC